MTKKKFVYPGEREAEEARTGNIYDIEEPDFIAGKPNYHKFAGWTSEEMLCWLNID